MTTKTLGQVLYEGTIYTRMPWSMLHSPARDDYERMAQAVAAVVREQCAQACEAERVSECDASDGVYNTATEHCAMAIRSMK